MHFCDLPCAVGSQGTTESVPKSEIQSVVAVKFFVVEVVIDAGVDPLPNGMRIGFGRKELVAEVSIDVEPQHQGHKCQKGNRVQGHDEEQNGYDTCFQYRFHGVE